MVHAFDEATAVKPAGAGRYEAVLDEDWSIAGKLNGGYLLAVAARAALAEAGEGHEHPLATTAAFPAPAPAGPALVTVEPLRLGRATSVLRVRLSPLDGGTAYLEALVTAGRITAGAPVVPAPAVPSSRPRSGARGWRWTRGRSGCRSSGSSQADGPGDGGLRRRQPERRG